MSTEDQQTLSEADTAPMVLDAHLAQAGTNDAQPLPADEVATKWSAIDNLTNVRDTLVKQREWAIAKTEGVRARLADAGGDPSPAAKALLDEIDSLVGAMPEPVPADA